MQLIVGTQASSGTPEKQQGRQQQGTYQKCYQHQDASNIE
jgi:hypothetical protein